MMSRANFAEVTTSLRAPTAPSACTANEEANDGSRKTLKLGPNTENDCHIGVVSFMEVSVDWVVTYCLLRQSSAF